MKPTVRIFKDVDEMSRAAAELFVTLATQATRERGRFLVAFSGGSTPTALYRLLAVYDVLIKHLPIPSENIHRVASDLEPDAAATDYARVLKEYAVPPLDWPRFDLVLLGMGEDGHTASLFPGSPVDATEPVIAVTAHYQGRPAQRVTLTPLVFNAARQVVFLVTGANKAVTLTGVFGDYNSVEQIPAKRIQPTDGKVTWLVDEAAGMMINRSGD
jgi:6-phosphogluconolactonase